MRHTTKLPEQKICVFSVCVCVHIIVTNNFRKSAKTRKNCASAAAAPLNTRIHLRAHFRSGTYKNSLTEISTWPTAKRPGAPAQREPCATMHIFERCVCFFLRASVARNYVPHKNAPHERRHRLLLITPEPPHAREHRWGQTDAC